MQPKHLSLIAALPNWAGQIKLNAANQVRQKWGAKLEQRSNVQRATATGNGQRVTGNGSNNNLLQKYKLEHFVEAVRRRNAVRIYGPAGVTA